MTQLDLDTLNGSGGEGGVSGPLETLMMINGDPEENSNFPSESFYLRKPEDQLDWLNNNAFLERKESTRRNSTSNSNSGSIVSTSQRLSLTLKSTASIIGLPKSQESCFVDCKLRRNCKPSSRARLFITKRSRSSGKSTAPPSEPSSPKVSCIGRVRSKTERSRSLRIQNHPASSSSSSSSKTPKPEKTGFWSNFKAVLRIGRQKPKSIEEESPPLKSSAVPAAEKKGREREGTRRTESDPPGLGGLKRFASGRKAESWGGSELDFDVPESDSSDHHRGSLFRRRSVGPLEGVDCVRDLESVGPASV